MRVRHLLFTIFAALPLLTAPTCQTVDDILIQSPASTLVSTFTFQIQFQLVGAFVPGTLEASLNFTPLSVSGGPVYTATVNPGPPLQDHNVLLLRARRQSDNKFVTRGMAFDYLPPKARAFVISDASVLPHGPLAHGKLGDYMLENSDVRIVVQDAGQRDLYSVGAFGGNIIDAVRVADPNRDNFLEVQPMLNIETVINAISVEIVNDGQDGTAAIIRTCGPDDLLDFVNPSGQIRPFAPAINFPPLADDNDQPIEACTEYRLAPQKSYVTLETTVENMGAVPLKLFVGDWMNGGGELEQWFAPGAGFGAGLFGEFQSLAFVGYGEAQGIDYSYVSIPTQEVQAPTDVVEKSNFFNTSGVSVILNNMDIIQAVAVGALPPFTVPAGGTKSYKRYFGVGDGSGSNTSDIRNEVLGSGVGTLAGCVSVGGAAAPGARVAVGQPINLATLTSTKLISNAETDASGCYSLTLPVGNYDVAAARRGTPYQGGGTQPLVSSAVPITLGNTTIRDFALPATGRLRVTVTDASNAALPARVSVVGFDPSPEPIIPGTILFGFTGSALGLFNDPSDRVPFGITRAAYAGASGIVEFDVEPGAYHVYVSRGTEYSLFTTAPASPVSVTAGATTDVAAQIAPVLDTTDFISSDFHVHGIASADSRVSDTNRVMQFSGEGVDNVIMTDHHAHKDLNPRIAALGLGAFLTSTIGEEITTFDYGHFNGYPFTVDASLPSRGSTDWGIAAPAGMDFPSLGAYTRDPGADPCDRAHAADGDARHHGADQPHRQPLPAAQDRHVAGAAVGRHDRGRSTRFPPESRGRESLPSLPGAGALERQLARRAERVPRPAHRDLVQPSEPGAAHDGDLRHGHAHIHRSAHRRRAHLDGISHRRRAGRRRARERGAGRRRREGRGRAGRLRADAARLRGGSSAGGGSHVGRLDQRLRSQRRARPRDPGAGADLGGVRPDPDLRQRGDGQEFGDESDERESLPVQRRSDGDAEPRDRFHAQRRCGGSGPGRRPIRDEPHVAAAGRPARDPAHGRHLDRGARQGSRRHLEADVPGLCGRSRERGQYHAREPRRREPRSERRARARRHERALLRRALALRGLTLQLAAGLALASALAPSASAQGLRAAGGVEIVAAIDHSDLCVVGRTRSVRELDAKGYTAQLIVEQALGSGAASGSALAIAWEELASARPPRFASEDRVLICLEALPGSTLWLRRFPDPEQRRTVLVVASRGGAFLRDPLPGSLDELEHYARLTPADRAGSQGAARLVALAARAEMPIAEDAVARLSARETLARQLDAELASQLIEALLRPDASEALQQGVLRLIAERHPTTLRPPLEALASRKPPPSALVFEALARLDGGLPPERSAALLRDASPERRATAARFASGPDAASRLTERLRSDPDAGVRAAAVSRLVSLEQERALTTAMATLADEDADVRLAGARAVASLGAAAVPDLRAAVEAGRQPAASTAIAALRMTATEEAHAALVVIAKSHPDVGIRKLAGLAIGEPIGETHTH